MRSKIRLFEFVLFMSYACASATPSSASYDVSTNVLTVNFSESVSTENVLLGRITITDGSNSYTLTGGTLPDSSYYTNSLAISLVYGTVIDQLEQAIFGSTQNIELWGIEPNPINSRNAAISEAIKRIKSKWYCSFKRTIFNFLSNSILYL